MDKEELQNLWDIHLVYGWRADIGMSNLVCRFLDQANPSLLGKRGAIKSFDEVKDYLKSIGIRRCLDRANKETLEFLAFEGPVRAFIAQRSPKLSSCLFNEKNNPEDILSAINSFKWTRTETFRWTQN